MKSLISVSLFTFVLVGLALSCVQDAAKIADTSETSKLTRTENLARVSRRQNTFYRGSGRRAIVA
ncbi:MAG: hypothetical protein NZ772_02425 [Cyanobacteria bacterium]|nr:hypothetical protein [Cyanobacteriota bacterium]MDW8199694.1 hypothetical protein [Cyanobacteriota bacterium SKYGB_h_bin112]